MPIFYLDASALVKRYTGETGFEVLDTLFAQRDSNDRLVASFVIAIEIAGLVSRLRRGRTITHQRSVEILDHFSADVEHDMELVDISRSVQAGALRLAREHGTRTADAIHLATIVELNVAATALGITQVVIVADRTLRNAIAREGIESLDPEERNAIVLLNQWLH